VLIPDYGVVVHGNRSVRLVPGRDQGDAVARLTLVLYANQRAVEQQGVRVVSKRARLEVNAQAAAAAAYPARGGGVK
jgi:hypothetical protein